MTTISAKSLAVQIYNVQRSKIHEKQQCSGWVATISDFFLLDSVCVCVHLLSTMFKGAVATISDLCSQPQAGLAQDIKIHPSPPPPASHTSFFYLSLKHLFLIVDIIFISSSLSLSPGTVG